MFGSLYGVHIEGHLGSFQFSPIRTKAAIAIFAQASLWTHAFIFLGKQLGVDFLAHNVWWAFYYKKLPDFFPKVIKPFCLIFYAPTNSV